MPHGKGIYSETAPDGGTFFANRPQRPAMTPRARPRARPDTRIGFVVTYLLMPNGLGVKIGSSLRRQGVEYKEKLDEYRARRQ